ncbi:peptidase [Amaricoccus solimangrovi]|uniref:Peptidase n=1 Tax=Amaricoccus solimangrovi TaxID=2589815 RepID=A0A501WDJ5_9RHOB|nr:peptidase [Amaricoccus solimangrovi]TPE46555.1 peptidase [Amaricoccus solimangrovi]
MTYCVGLLLDAGLVMLSDTRTNAGLDHISIYRKMFVFENPGDRVIAIMTAGSLSITQTVIAKLQHEIDNPDATPASSIMLAETMLDVAEIIGQTLSDVSVSIGEKMARMESRQPHASMIVGGQRRGGEARLFLVYSEGNFIEATEDTPYFQIGEHKYGKPILDRVVHLNTSIEEGRKVVLLSMDSTMRSNLSVGMPLDLLTVRRDAYRVASRERIEPGDPTFSAMSDAWSRALRDAFHDMPG